MNKFFTLIAISTILHSNVTGQIKAGLQGGGTISEFITTNHFGDQSFFSYSTNPFASFSVGLSAEIVLRKRIALQSGISIVSKGSGLLTQNSFNMNYRNIQVIYLQVPVNIVYKYYKGKENSAFFGAGLYAGRGVWGAEAGNGFSFNGSSSKIGNKVIFSSENPGQSLPTNIKPFDIGFNVLAGVTLHRFEISAIFSRGFSNVLSNAELYNGNYKNTTVSFLLAYYITFKKQ
ncbi:MAG: outer membrane beta-barrel protein [Ferruginibacter sp.]